MNTMTCRNCGAGLEAGQIDASLGVATCSHCGSLHSVPSAAAVHEPNTGVGATGSPVQKPKIDAVSLPSKYSIRQSPDSLELKWSAGGLKFGLAIAIIGTAFGYVAIMSGQLFLLLACAGLYYFAAVRGLNTHRLRVDAARVEITQGPLPWPGKKILNGSDVTQLYASEHTTQHNNNDNQNRPARIVKHYRLTAQTRSNGPVKLVSGFRNPNQALWLEQEIENVLGLADRSVAGEHVK